MTTDGHGAAGRVLSVNVGGPRRAEWGGRTVVSAIWKVPVAGPVAVAATGLAGDAQADLRVHGGEDKAVYAYASEDYAWWEGELGTPLSPGTFGENLTVAGLDLTGAVIGEVWAVGTTRLAVTEPRTPCFKLGMRMGDAGFVQRFERAGRLGVYLRTVTAGELAAGDPVTLDARPTHGLTSGFVAEVQRTKRRADLERLAGAPDLPESWRAWAVRTLARAEGR